MNTADKIRKIEKKHHFQSDWFEEALQEMAEWKDSEFAQEKQKLIDEACEWLEKNDSYAIPTNVQVDRLREYLNNI